MSKYQFVDPDPLIHQDCRAKLPNVYSGWQKSHVVQIQPEPVFMNIVRDIVKFDRVYGPLSREKVSLRYYGNPY